jgi:hypothetical protein
VIVVCRDLALLAEDALLILPVQRVRSHQGNVRVRIAGLEVTGIHDGTTPVRSYCLDEPQELPASLQKITMVLNADANPVFLAMIGAFPESGRDPLLHLGSCVTKRSS